MQPIVKTSPTLAPCLLSHTWHLGHESDTQAWAQLLAQQPQTRELTLALQGTLGAGKTTLTRHLLRAMGVQGRIKSPSYAIVEPYTLQTKASPADKTSAWHFDFYRFNDPREWEDAGFRDLFASKGLKIIEWWENAQGLMPTPDWIVELFIVNEEARELTVHACTPPGLALLQHMCHLQP